MPRIEGDVPLGKRFALRATVAFQGTWIRLVRTFAEPEHLEAAERTFASAVGDWGIEPMNSVGRDYTEIMAPGNGPRET